jgi:hypothetical protein
MPALRCPVMSRVGMLSGFNSNERRVRVVSTPAPCSERLAFKS